MSPSSKYILVADCGSTKVEWAVITPDCGAEAVTTFKSTGFNAAVTPAEEIRSILGGQVAPRLAGFPVSELHFYGAGCIGGDVDRNLAQLLAEALPFVDRPADSKGFRIEVASDLLGAAKALFGDRPGIACILGTGSNSCVYDGSKIIANTPSLGYILGDEGSGASLGRRLLSDLFKGLLPEDLTAKFRAKYALSQAELIRHVYREPSANRYLASFCPFLSENLDCPQIRALVGDEFRRFFDRNFRQYEGINIPLSATEFVSSAELPVGFVGSIAFNFSELLSEVCETVVHARPRILRAPLGSLLEYHSSI